MNFQKDLKLGQNYEMKFIELMKFKKYHQPKGYFKYFDIEVYDIPEKVIKYEIKSDRLANKTGNLCIEFECSKKASGIITTQADYYGYFILKENNEFDLYVIPVSVIRDMINKKSYTRIMKGGDGWKACFYLFKINLFSNYIIKYNEEQIQQ